MCLKLSEEIGERCTLPDLLQKGVLKLALVHSIPRRQECRKRGSRSHQRVSDSALQSPVWLCSHTRSEDNLILSIT